MSKEELLPWERVGEEFRLKYKRAGMLVDLDRCIGCHSCSVSCKTENEVPLGNFRMRVRYLEQPDNKQISFTPLICMHCVDAPCLKACPSKAIRREDDSIQFKGDNLAWLPDFSAHLENESQHPLYLLAAKILRVV